MRYQNPFLINDRHRVFVSYYHTEDQDYRDLFERLFSDIHDIMVSESVEIGDIDDTRLSTDRIRQIIRDDYLRDSTVTVVLVGAHTWQRKFVDWEIGSSIRKTQYNSRSGLLGILLPTFPRHTVLSGTLPSPLWIPTTDIRTVSENGRLLSYDSRRIPPRLHDNIECGFAKIYPWTDNPDTVQSWIHEAFKRRDKNPPPDNSYPSFKKNRTSERWSN